MKKLAITIYKTDGSIEQRKVNKNIGLEFWQELVGGLITVLGLEIDGKSCDLLCNDEGLLLGLDENPHSKKLLTYAGYPEEGEFYLVGDLVLIDGNLP